MKFMGFLREDGQVGVRNHVAVLPTIGCANEMASEIAKRVKDVVAITHNHSCVRFGQDQERAKRVLVGIGCNPNIYSVLLVGTGCESIKAEELAEEINKKTKKRVEFVTLENEGQFENVINKGIEISRNMVEEASQLTKEACDIENLTLGIKCGGSSTLSAVASNPSVGKVADILVAEGGKVIFSETAELIGSEDILIKRASNQNVAKELKRVAHNMRRSIKNTGIDIRGSEPTKGNIKAGLTTLEEKSLGSIIKVGTSPIKRVLEYAGIPNSKGLSFMDGPSFTPPLLLGMFASGAQILIFSFGGGLPAKLRGLPACPCGLNVLPTIKVVSTLETQDRKYFDICADDIINGTCSINRKGEEIISELIKVASGKLTITETQSNYSEPLDLYATAGDGLLM
jgi:altronate dehydratase large subunit